MLVSNIHYLRLFNSHSYTYLHSEHDTCGKKRYVVFWCVRVCVLSICVSCIMTKKKLYAVMIQVDRILKESEKLWIFLKYSFNSWNAIQSHVVNKLCVFHLRHIVPLNLSVRNIKKVRSLLLSSGYVQMLALRTEYDSMSTSYASISS